MKWLLGVLLALPVVVGALYDSTRFAGGVLFESAHPPVATVQRGFRGTGLELIYNPRKVEDLSAENSIPYYTPPASNASVPAATLYKNLQVLGDVGVDEFTRLMVNMANWVAPKEGCPACHNVNDFADDSRYTKVVARRMLQMVRHINADWTQHVKETGVTCYTCHRGQLVPPNVWFNDPSPNQAAGYTQRPLGKNHPAPVAGGSALYGDPYTTYLEKDTEIRVQGKAALYGTNPNSIKQAESTYALMISMAQALGVNCDHCHNTRTFFDWNQSTPQRVQAWYGIRMVRNLNNEYLDPLKSVFPQNRLGPLGDSPKVACITCHNGVYKPLFGVSMAKNFPELRAATATAPAPAPSQ